MAFAQNLTFGLQNDLRRLANLQELFSNEEAMGFVADNHALVRRSLHALQTQCGLLQHGLLTGQREKLFRVHRTRGGPEARAGTTGKYDREDFAHR